MKTPLNSQWEIPKNWEIVSLNDITSDWRGGAPLEPEDFTTQGFAVLHKGGIQRGGKIVIDAKKKTFTTEKYAQRYQKSVIDKTYMAATLRDLVPSGPSIGLIADLAKSPSEKYILAQGAYGFKIDLNRVKPSYLVWLSNYEPFREYIKRYCVGSTQIHIRTPVFQELKIPLPPLSYQWKIAEVLDRAQSLISKRREAIAELDTLTQAIFLEMFGDPAFNPQKWRRVQLVDLCNSANDIKCGPFGTQLGKDEYTTEGVPLWGIKNVNALFKIPTREFLEARTAKRLMQYSIEPGDIVMTRKGTVGNCAVYPDSYPLGIMHSDLLRLRVSLQKCNSMFLSHQLHYSRDVELQLALISGGAIMPGINVTKLKSVEVLVPPVSLQSEFAHRVEAVEKLKAAHRASLSELHALFASLQHRAFRGEL